MSLLSPLGPGREFDRIRKIAERLGPAAAGLGDDCAIIPSGTGTSVTSTDVALEGVHFRREWLSPAEIGWRATAAALSDLAAAGAAPAGVLAALLLPLALDDTAVLELMDGVGDAARTVGATVLGGDLTRSPVLGVGLTVFGRAERPMSRVGVRPGDRIWVTGALGGARAAVVQWERGGEPDPESRAAFARPAPRIAAGQWLAAHGARALLDLSDGLAGDAAHLAAASGVELRIALERLPLHPGAASGAALAGERAETFAAIGGEDYELLVALPPEFGDHEAEALAGATGIRISRIGEAVSGHGVRLLLDGRDQALRSWDHFG